MRFSYSPIWMNASLFITTVETDSKVISENRVNNSGDFIRIKLLVLKNRTLNLKKNSITLTQNILFA